MKIGTTDHAAEDFTVAGVRKLGGELHGLGFQALAQVAYDRGLDFRAQLLDWDLSGAQHREYHQGLAFQGIRHAYSRSLGYRRVRYHRRLHLGGPYPLAGDL